MATTRARAPRGTKILTQAFFAALADIPESQQEVVARAAQVAIRDQLRVRREKERAARARMRKAPSRAATASRPRRAAEPETV